MAGAVLASENEMSNDYTYRKCGDEVSGFIVGKENDEQRAYELIKELRDAAADFLHCESCGYNAIAIVAPRNRLRAALVRFDGAQP